MIYVHTMYVFFSVWLKPVLRISSVKINYIQRINLLQTDQHKLEIFTDQLFNNKKNPRLDKD